MENKFNKHDKPNLSIFDSIRTIASFWIVILHCHFISCIVFFPVTSPNVLYVEKIPVFGFLITTPWAVDIFWILSSFLCEYQLHRMEKMEGCVKYIFFLLNRFLRLCPLYLIGILFGPCTLEILVNHQSFFTILPGWIVSLFFCDIVYSNRLIRCSGVAWSVEADVHGYLFLVITFIIFVNPLFGKELGRTIRKFFLLFCVLVGTIGVCVMFWHLDGEYHYEEMYKKYAYFGKELINSIPRNSPEYDELREYQKANMEYAEGIYFTSIHWHASGYFLGSILATNILQRNRKSPYFLLYTIIKLVALLPLFIIFYLTPRRLSFVIFVWIVYLVLDLLLTSLNKESNIVSKWISFSLANPVWKFISNYTYGIYVIHIPVIVLVNLVVPWKKNAEDYTMFRIILRSIIAFFISLILSVLVLRVFVEFLPNWVRKKYVSSYYSRSSQNERSENGESEINVGMEENQDCETDTSKTYSSSISDPLEDLSDGTPK